MAFNLELRQAFRTSSSFNELLAAIGIKNSKTHVEPGLKRKDDICNIGYLLTCTVVVVTVPASQESRQRVASRANIGKLMWLHIDRSKGLCCSYG